MALTAEEQAELEALENDPEVQQYLAQQKPQSQQAPIPSTIEAQTSMPEAFLRGAAQGATFGFADELSAMAEHGAGYLPFVPEKSYDQALSEARAEYNLAEQEYPVTSLLGDIAGGVGQATALSMAAPGAGTAATTGGLISKLRKVAGLIKAPIMPAKEAKALSNIAKAAKAGAIIGGATGVGRSEKEGLQSLQDAAPAALVGGALGGVLSGAGQAIGKAGESISKKIDAGEAPYSFQMIRDAWRSGKEGQGYVTMKNRKDIEQGLMDVAEKTVRPEIKNTVDELRTVRNHILSNIDTKVTINKEINDLIQGLNKIGFEDAKKVASDIASNYVNKTGKNTAMSLADANEMANIISDAVSKPELTGKIKELAYKTSNNIKDKVRANVSDDASVLALYKDPKMLNIYERYLGEVSPQDLANIIKRNTKSPLSNEQALQKAEDVKDIILATIEAVKGDDPKALSDLVLGNPHINKALVESSPIKVLDNAMAKVLSASESLQDVSSGRTDSEKLNDVIKIFKNLAAQTKDTTGGMVAKARYDEAMSNIRQVAPEAAKKIEEAVNPALKKLEIKKYLEGASLGEGIKETGVVKEAIKNMGQLTAGAANILGQIQGASKIGKGGPIPAATTMLRPTTSFLQSVKSNVDSALNNNPNSKIMQVMSNSLDNAIKENDEGRRAAILNTLMQYESFRKMINKDEEE